MIRWLYLGGFLLCGCSAMEKIPDLLDAAAPAAAMLGGVLPPPLGAILASVGALWTTVRGGHGIQYAIEAVKAAEPGRMVGRPA